MKKSFLAKSVKSQVLNQFNKTDLSLAGSSGLSLESLRVATVLASLHKNEEVGTEVKEVLKSGV